MPAQVFVIARLRGIKDAKKVYIIFIRSLQFSLFTLQFINSF